MRTWLSTISLVNAHVCVKACVHVPKILSRLSELIFFSLFPSPIFYSVLFWVLKKLAKVPTTHTRGPNADIGKTLLAGKGMKL